MSLMTDVKATHLNASGSVCAGPSRLAGFSLVGGATAGTIQFKDGGSGGTILCELDVPGNTNVNSFYILVPGTGIRFYTSIYASFTGGLAASTVFYQG